MSSGLVGLGSGAIGGFIGGKFDEVGRSSTAKFFSDKATKATNYITAGLNGFGDRYVSSKLNGESGKQSLTNGLFGLGDGLYLSHFWGNKFVGTKGSYGRNAYRGLTGRYLSSAITQAGTSMPGFGYSLAYWHHTFSLPYNGFFGGAKQKFLNFPSAAAWIINTRFAINRYEDTYTSAIMGPRDFIFWRN